MNSIKLLLIVLILFVFSMNSRAQSGIDKLKFKESKGSLLNSNLSTQNYISETKAKKEKDFFFSTNLYLWALSISGTTALPVNRPPLTITQTPELDISLDFSEALKYLKFGFMLAGKFVYKNAGLLYDVYYGKLEFNGTVPVASSYISGTVVANQFTGDFALLYRFPMKNKKVSLSGYAGTRIISMDNTIDLFHEDNTILSVNKAKLWVDPIIGADSKIDLSKHWMMYIKGDLGGFGVSSKFTGSLVWTVGYKFTENWNSNIGVKYLYVDYNKDNFLWKVSQYGMLFSFGYMFN